MIFYNANNFILGKICAAFTRSLVSLKKLCAFSCGYNNCSSTWSDNHRVHTIEYYHCALLRCEPEDDFVVWLGNHTDYKDT